MLCSRCKNEIDDEARFCPFCGNRIVSNAPMSAPTPAMQPDNTDEQPTALDIQRYGITNKTIMSTGADSMPPISRPQGRRELTSFEPADTDYLEKHFGIRIEYAVNRIILEGGNVNFMFRVHKLNSCLSNVDAWGIVYYEEQTKNLDFSQHSWEDHGSYLSNFIPFSHTEGTGDLFIEYYLMCNFSGEAKFFRFSVQHHIIPKGQSIQTLNATITLNGGSLIDGDIMPNLFNNGDNPFGSGDNLIRQLNQEPPRFQPMAFTATDWRPEKLWLSPYCEYKSFPCSRLTLRLRDNQYIRHIIHLLASETISIGRDASQNDIELRDWHNPETYTGKPSTTVSHRHGCFTYHENRVSYTDMSSYGTGIIFEDQGPILLYKGGETQCNRLPERGSISLGAIRLAINTKLCYGMKRNRLCRTCPRVNVNADDDYPCSSMFLKRIDNLPEVFAFVWKCADLTEICPELQNITVYRRNGELLLETQDAQLWLLAPGLNIPLANGHILQVMPFTPSGAADA